MPELKDLFESSQSRLTKSQKVIAAYLLAHEDDLAFETASSIAERIGLSTITVGRFARALGFDNFAALQQSMRKSPPDRRWLVGNRYDAFQDNRKNVSHLARSLNLEIDAIQRAYAVVGTSSWNASVDMLTRSSNVYIAGFVGLRGIAMHFANHLSIVRDNVTLSLGDNSTFSEVLLPGADNRCLVIIDVRRYSRQARKLAARAHETGLPLTIITDPYCYWARDYTDNVIIAHSDTNLFWDSTAALSCILGLLVNSVIENLGDDLGSRLQTMVTLQNDFGEFED